MRNNEHLALLSRGNRTFDGNGDQPRHRWKLSRSEQYAIHPLPARRQPETSFEGRFTFPEIVEADNDEALPRAGAALARPLVVDLDGTLIRSDLLIEAAFSELGQRPHAIVGMLRALRDG